MSDYQQYINEKDNIDDFIQKGFLISHVRENLDGAYVEFSHPVEGKKETVLIGTANARKYFSSILIRQNG
ncbi:hypothetical protein AN964_17475 [Heyndrickxia shackletonii]|uniref:Uncharacterized protein n=1 Tax=Heyndrickxia shackletonii TaxID=157838 RepID=A0A0Q3WZM9_9BACI|nr:hypothetical protein [Heyndrickxia shackletonii]KQL55122.1 hypothetical protein AN964_17475 [Heyndrickxia shackletonii]MBB2482386.1 hypothetical protein [Bacillus sp. APMAM]NEY98837.1 hypothetical protein [Heyndrickxia shackletonii]RTZ54241.1 hypothetical protein EKO25_19090 [Bacillus sp. SAJ1]